MVKDCMSKGHGFIIVFQKQYSNTNDYEISKKGSYVEIIDFNSLSNGLLGITVKSINKVIIKDLTQLEDGLHIANTHPLIDPEVDDQALLAELAGCMPILLKFCSSKAHFACRIASCFCMATHFAQIIC